MNIRRQTVGIRGTALLAIVVAVSAGAADVEEEIKDSEDDIAANSDGRMVYDWRSSPWIRFRVGGNSVPDADFGSAEVTSTWIAGGIKMLIPASDRLAFRVDLRSGVAIYDFDGDKEFLDSGRTSGDPFDELIETAFSVGGGYQLNDSWAIVGRTVFNSRREDDASFGSGIRVGGVIGASYDWRDRVSLILGVGIRSRMVKSGVKVSPVYQVKWNINDRFKLVVDGMKGRLTGKVNDAFRLSVFGGIGGKLYRLEDRGGAVGKGTIRDRRKFVGLRGDWRVNPRWRVRTELGSILEQEFKIEDSDGDTFDKTHTDSPAFFGSLRFEYRFGK